EWLHEHIPGGITAEDCRAAANSALRLAASSGHMNVLEWLQRRIPESVTAENCRVNNNFALQCAAHRRHVNVLEWLATKLTLAEFAEYGCEDVWLQVRRGSMLALVVAGKWKKIRLPSELWELVWELVEPRY
ncbi:MAG: hypothetical protein EBU92_11650, partial [Betaproteobacteria bacterium]|nr:hypothetical protein [Betaproteobacteria bacterium]